MPTVVGWASVTVLYPEDETCVTSGLKNSLKKGGRGSRTWKETEGSVEKGVWLTVGVGQYRAIKGGHLSLWKKTTSFSEEQLLSLWKDHQRVPLERTTSPPGRSWWQEQNSTGHKIPRDSPKHSRKLIHSATNSWIWNSFPQETERS